MSLKPLLQGKRVRLTAFERDDLAEYKHWYQNPDFIRLYDGRPAYPRSKEELEKWLEGERADKSSYLFAIRTRADNELIGATDLTDIMWTHGVGWIAVAIGEPDQRGKGYGSEAMELLLEFAFSELNLHRIQLTVFEYNDAAIALYEKLGFTREGRLREPLHRDGKRYDMYLYGLLRREWKSTRG